MKPYGLSHVALAMKWTAVFVIVVIVIENKRLVWKMLQIHNTYTLVKKKRKF